MNEIETQVLVVGGGLGGAAAALAALTMGCRVVLTEESQWIGGQLTSQAVPPDEHPWIEDQGSSTSYQRLRTDIRNIYRRSYPLTDKARVDPTLNPGQGSVSRLCHEPRVAVAALEEELGPYRANGQLVVKTECEPVGAETDGDRVTTVQFRFQDRQEIAIAAAYVVDATELGDLLELAGVEHVTGSESRNDTGELHALDGPAQPLDQQAFSWCFALDYAPDTDHTIDKPTDYAAWRSYRPEFWPGPLLSWTDVHPHTLEPRTRPIFTDPESWRGAVAPDLWNFRRIFTTRHHRDGLYRSDVTLVNWPQIDYMSGPLLGVTQTERDRHLAAARAQSLSFLYWMQTEAPRLDGGAGYPGLRLRGDLLGGRDLAMRPYIRESRRIRAEFTVREEHVGVQARESADLPPGSAVFDDSVGVGCYRIDLHPSSGVGGNPRNYVDVACYPFQLPLGALVPQRATNLLPGNKNIGTTHITNGCYRLHPVEWTIGEVAGALAGYCLRNNTRPHAVRNEPTRLEDFQHLLTDRFGAQLAWPERIRTSPR